MQGLLTFEKDASFSRNEVHNDGAFEVGKGGAISNTGPGSIRFKGKLNMEDNTAQVYRACRRRLAS